MFANKKLVFGVVGILFAVSLSLAALPGSASAGVERRSFWSLNGNRGTSPDSNYLGTIDYQPLVLRTNGTEWVRVDPIGRVGIGISDPTRRLDINGFIKQTNGHMLFKDGWGNAVFVVEDGTVPPDQQPNRFVFRSVPDLDGYDAGPPVFDIMTIENTGHVGIGTQDPNSTLEISNGYIELDTSAGTPPAADCDAADEVGRMKVDSANTNLYICTAIGWVTK